MSVDEIIAGPKHRWLAYLLVLGLPLGFSALVLWKFPLELDNETVLTVVLVMYALWLVPGVVFLNHMLTTIVLTPEAAEKRPRIGRRVKVFWIDALELKVLLDQNGSDPGEMILKGKDGRIVLTNGKQSYLQAARFMLTMAQEHGVELRGPVAAFEQGLMAALMGSCLGDLEAVFTAPAGETGDGQDAQDVAPD